MSITRSLLDIVREEMKACGVTVLKRLKLRVGELTAVEPGTLRFCFEACVKGTSMEGALLDIETVSTGSCRGCGAALPVGRAFMACPGCGGVNITRATGHELDIVSMEAE